MLYSSACEYAIRALTCLAERQSPAFVQLRDVATTEAMPAAFVGKILQDLVRAGLLRSAKGPHGGYALARPPEAISLLEVKAAVDGTADLERCAVGLGRCSDEMPCPQHEIFKPLRTAIRQYLAGTTLAQMATALAQKRLQLARARADAAAPPRVAHSRGPR
jgi:Rrf2 family protein